MRDGRVNWTPIEGQAGRFTCDAHGGDFKPSESACPECGPSDATAIEPLEGVELSITAARMGLPAMLHREAAFDQHASRQAAREIALDALASDLVARSRRSTKTAERLSYLALAATYYNAATKAADTCGKAMRSASDATRWREDWQHTERKEQTIRGQNAPRTAAESARGIH